jgi:hypothetical protein
MHYYLHTYLCMLVSRCVPVAVVSLLVLVFVVVSDELPVVDCGGLQAIMAAIKIRNPKKMFFIN